MSTSFDSTKHEVLSRPDRSSKGSWDAPIVPLLELLNAREEYFSTSSCSGRVVLIAPGSSKKEASWLFKSHGELPIASLREVLQALPRGEVWLRVEPLILHVTARSLESANWLVQRAQEAGLKRSGFVQFDDLFRVTIRGHDEMALPVAADGELLVSEEYLDLLAEEASSKLEKNLSRVERFERILQQNR